MQQLGTSLQTGRVVSREHGKLGNTCNLCCGHHRASSSFDITGFKSEYMYTEQNYKRPMWHFETFISLH